MSRWGALGVLLLVAALGALSLRLTAPPEPLGAEAPVAEFSAARALAHVEAIAGAPRPPGTAAHRRAEEYIVAELESLGLETRLQEGWAVHSWGADVAATRVRNIVARRAGTGGGPAVVLLSHYDSVPTGPGAGDDAAGVAATLEALRALREAPPPRNDILVLVTDGEEGGLFGARLLIEEPPWAGEIGVVLNFEARGNRGVVQMFQIGPGDGPLVRALAAVAPHPYASSLSGEVYRRMPNDSDLTIFLDAGHRGMNFAMIGDHAAYHTELDTPERLSLASLQHHGSYALAMARHFGSIDLEQLEREELVYFNPLGGSWLAAYSLGMARLLAVLAVSILGSAIYLGFRTNRLDIVSVRRGALVWPLPIAGSAILALGSWNALVRLFPAVVAAPHADPYAADRLLAGLVVVAVGVLGLAAAAVGGSRPRGLLAGVAMPWVLGAVALTIWVPGASYLLLWPALAASIALLVAVSWPDDRWLPLWLGAGAVLGAMLFTPMVALAVQALGLRSTLVVGVAIGLPLTLLLPLAADLVAGRAWIPLAVLVAGLALFAWTGAAAAPAAATPAPTSLVYLYDADRQEAFWMSYGAEIDEWTAQVLPASTVPGPPPSFLPGAADAKRLLAPAPGLEVEPPRAELVEDVFEESIRHLSFRVRSPRRAPFLMVAPDPSLATLRAIGVAGKLVEVEAGEDPLLLLLENLPPEGVVVTLETFDRQPVELDLLDWSFGLPELEGVELAPRPPHLLRSTRWASDSLLVHAAYWF